MSTLILTSDLIYRLVWNVSHSHLLETIIFTWHNYNLHIFHSSSEWNAISYIIWKLNAINHLIVFCLSAFKITYFHPEQYRERAVCMRQQYDKVAQSITISNILQWTCLNFTDKMEPANVFQSWLVRPWIQDFIFKDDVLDRIIRHLWFWTDDFTGLLLIST